MTSRRVGFGDVRLVLLVHVVVLMILSHCWIYNDGRYGGEGYHNISGKHIAVVLPPMVSRRELGWGLCIAGLLGMACGFAGLFGLICEWETHPVRNRGILLSLLAIVEGCILFGAGTILLVGFGWNF